MTQPKNPMIDPREADRKERMAMILLSNNLYRALVREHPKIVQQLQALPNAQPVLLDVDT